MAQLRQQRTRIEEAGGQLVLVVMATPAQATDFAGKFDLPFLMIADPDRQLYQAFGLRMASPWELLAPSLAVKALGTMAAGHSVGLPIGDVRQLPGAFIIDTEGTIVYRHAATDAADHPQAEAIVAALAELGSQADRQRS